MDKCENGLATGGDEVVVRYAGPLTHEAARWGRVHSAAPLLVLSRSNRPGTRRSGLESSRRTAAIVRRSVIPPGAPYVSRRHRVTVTMGPVCTAAPDLTAVTER
jgi:hypothetical protein